jgi:Ca2+-binding RTX toxin-like protein
MGVFTMTMVALVPPAGAAQPKCFGKKATIVGTKGDDDLTGTRGRDVIVSKGGEDEIDSRGARTWYARAVTSTSFSRAEGTTRSMARATST